MPSHSSANRTSVGSRSAKLRPRILRSTLVLACGIAFGSVPQETDAAPFQASDLSPSEELRYFENEIRPLLVRACLECHSGTSAEGNLVLDDRQALLTGGDRGPAVIPGDAQGSLLLAAVEYHDLEMPPDGRLDDDSIDKLRRWIEMGLPWPASERLRPDHTLTTEDRNHWSFRPIESPPLPMIAESDWVRDDLDVFVHSAQLQLGIVPAPEADRLELARRVAFDLTGLPPTPELLDAYLNDNSPEAYETLVDRLLESRAFGERWADTWFDWVRYAESDGYKADSFRPTAWRYRDYVIDALVEDRPFDRFLLEQLAGDLIEPVTAESIAATGYLRLWIYEYNQRDARTQWTVILDDLTETTSDAFLGLGLGCAKCHDHKYDPLSQEDYYRLQACFAGISADDATIVASDEQREAYRTADAAWKERHRELLDELAAIESALRHDAARSAIEKFPPDIVALFNIPEVDRTSLERQLIELANRQVEEEVGKLDFAKRLSPDQLLVWQGLRERLELAAADRPQPPAITLGVAEIPNAIQAWPVAGDEEHTVAAGPPRVLTSIDRSPDFDPTLPRRLELARWIVSNDNPLTARVMVNRVWQQLFGRGLVDSPSDFGRLTQAPRMPELLDFLSDRWRRDGWSLKRLIRGIVTSATYRQAVSHPAEDLMVAIDPDRATWWRMQRRRLDSGQLRDAMLAVSGELQQRGSGPSAAHDSPCRSVYLKVLRNDREPLLDAFDFPDRIRTQGCRNVTTSPLQALLLMNHPWTLQRAAAMAERVRSAAGQHDAGAVDQAFRTAFSRGPTSNELNAGLEFLTERQAASIEAGSDAETSRRDAWIDLCHGLLNSNEFLFLE